MRAFTFGWASIPSLTLFRSLRVHKSTVPIRLLAAAALLLTIVLQPDSLRSARRPVTGSMAIRRSPF